MFYKILSLFVLIFLLTSLLPTASYSEFKSKFSSPSDSDEIDTEVIIKISNGEILAFSARESHWVSISGKLSERVIRKKTVGNIGIVATTKRLLGFSVITGQWTTENLTMNEEIREITVEGNVATVNTNKRLIGFSAHTGEWIEAPE